MNVFSDAYNATDGTVPRRITNRVGADNSLPRKTS